MLQLNIPPDDLGELPPPKGDPEFELKHLLDNLKYAYLDDKKIYPVIISANLSAEEEIKLLDVLKAGPLWARSRTAAHRHPSAAAWRAPIGPHVVSP